MIYKSEKPAILMLDNGQYFEGIGFGASKKVSGEITFNTIPGSGYVELLTNPTNKGKIIVCTYPSIGNYGVPAKERDKFGIIKHFESDSIHINGLVVSEYCYTPSHYESIKTLEEWLIEEDIPAIQWVDSRRLTQYLVKNKTTMGILQVFNRNSKPNIQALRKEATELNNLNKKNLMELVSTSKVKTYTCEHSKATVLIIDLGVKNNILRVLLEKKINLIVVPYNFPYNKIVDLEPDGILISNGPGNPKTYTEIVNSIRQLLNTNIPVVGIGLGHILLGKAAGAEIYKMKAPHRGGRTTVQNITNQCYITYQNHGYCLKNLKKNGFSEYFHDKDDGSNEGLIHKNKPIFSVLFNPEGSPGPLDTKDLIFDKFIELIEVNK
jgi:carbamoyl-phosphate synthase small subunit